MSNIVDLDNYKTKQNNKKKNKKDVEIPMPKIYITKEKDYEYNIIVSNEGENTVFNKKPIPRLAIAVYAASYCKDRLSDYMQESLSTDIIVFDKECSAELNIE